MAGVQRKLVHKQFNSPMSLYSQDNVKATLDRELKAFGANGIEVDETIAKPLNLANSAVLRAVEEEEQMKCGYKRVAWPPASEERIIREFTPQPQTQPPVGQSYNQQPAQQYQQQHQQHHQQPPQPAAAASPEQGPIYNNVQRTARQVSPYPYRQQQQPHHQQPQQPPQQHNQPQQQNNYQQPSAAQEQLPESVQYPQGQFNRQPSHERAAEQTPQYHQDYQHAPHHMAQEPMSPGTGWKHIHPPVVKAQQQYQTPSGPDAHYGGYDAPQQQQPQYPAAPYNQYQQPSAPHYNQPQQQYQQPPPQNHYQPAPQQQVSPQQQQQQQQHYQPPQQQQYQSQPNWAHNQQQPQYQPTQYQQAPPTNYPSNQSHQHQQQPQYQAQPQVNQFNSYSQQHISQDQPDYQQQRQPSLPQDYRGASPGIITLRKETPVSQAPAPVYNSQPAAVSYQGGSNMRGDLKWPPPEYKEAAAKENEERRKLALGPVCRPRKVHRDYKTFFAKNALNCYYPSYKVPPGTQHMLS